MKLPMLGIWPVAIVLFFAFFIGCTNNGNQESTAVKKDQFVEFKSVLGNSLVLPSQFSSEEKGDTWVLTSKDGNAKITVLTFTAKGSGSPEDLRNLLEKSLEKDGTWKNATWNPVRLGNVDAVTKVFDPMNEKSSSACLAYVLQAGDYYQAILVYASPLVMGLNGGFYKECIRSFKCNLDKEVGGIKSP